MVLIKEESTGLYGSEEVISSVSLLAHDGEVKA